MDKLKEIDAYKLSAYNFYLAKSSRYTTCRTFILSLFIISLSVWISFSSIQNIWIPRSQLSISMTHINQIPQPFTTQPFCYSVPFQRALPEGILISNFNITGRQMLINEIELNFPEIIADIGERKFKCFSLQNFQLIDSNTQLQLKVNYLQNDIFFHLKTVSCEQIQSLNSGNVVRIDQSSTNTKIMISVNLIQASIWDKIQFNYNPEIIVAIQPLPLIHYFYQSTDCINQTCASIKKAVQNSQNPYSVLQLSIMRQHIGEIIGTIFSWLTTFTLVSALILIPIVEKKMKLRFSKILFFNQIIAKFQPNILKLYTPFCQESLFQVKVYKQAIEKIQRMLNIIPLLRSIKLIKKLTPQLPFRDQQNYSEIQFDSYAASDDSFSKIVNVNTNKKQKEQLSIFELEQENLPFTFNSLFLRLLRFFDNGVNQVTIKYSGKGFGSVKSTILTFVCLISTVLMFYYIGILENKKQTIFQIPLSDKNASHTILPSDLYFMLYNPYQSQYAINASLINSNNQIVDTFPLIMNTISCLQIRDNMLPNLNSTENLSDHDVFCFARSITISAQGPYLKIVLANRKLSESINFFYILKSSNPKKSQVQIETITASIGAQLYLSYQTKFQKFQFYNNKVLEFQAVQLSQIQRSNDQNPAVYFSLSGHPYQIVSLTSSFYDLFNNVYPLTMTIFSVILLKIAVKINTYEKQKIIPLELEQRRTDLPTILATIHKLLNGNNRQEVRRMKYYFKELLV